MAEQKTDAKTTPPEPPKIRVQVKERSGLVHRCRAGRNFSTAAATELEVLQQEEDFQIHHPNGAVTYDPETTIEVLVGQDPVSGRPLKEMRAHPGRIGQAGLRAILADAMLVTAPVPVEPPAP